MPERFDRRIGNDEFDAGSFGQFRRHHFNPMSGQDSSVESQSGFHCSSLLMLLYCTANAASLFPSPCFKESGFGIRDRQMPQPDVIDIIADKNAQDKSMPQGSLTDNVAE